ncbi:L-lactate dehydrogenase [Megasphaera hominis]|jgi:L-lactate dehydrogenase|uniref:L-lactate dehydrogenase n=1 Tax=Megasphaera hominis TaxID=159836 RepID=A0ABR6VJU0_9FIRM|nr:L-lactate dehydrogenase [Megasphaera hominis]MBC3536466.1 L-lactate dehydrogenase [Megasphaera hominis]
MIEKRIIGVAGLGHVGAHVAFCLGMMGVADEVLLCDANEKKVISECNDLNDAFMFMPNHTTYRVVDYAGLAEAHIIVNAVGDIRICQSLNRDDELANSVRQVSDYVPKVMAAGFNGYFVNITNPCDVITRLIQKLTGLPKNHVLGTGTMLDSSRLVHAICDATNLDSRGFFAFMMGEHGNSQFAPWSQVNFYGQTLDQIESQLGVKLDRAAIQEKAIQGGWLTLSGKGCTEYGIASAAATLVRTILHDEKRIISCSVELDGQYGEHDIYIGVPAIIGANGVEKVLDYELSEDEKATFKTCIAKVRSNIEKANAILAEK